MNTADWQLVKEILDGALALPPAERAGYVRDSCGDRLELRAEVESLLAAHDGAGDFLDPASLAPPEESLVGETLGAYRITGRIGDGGMGTVYRAERDDALYERPVALKVLKRGMDTEQIVRRFHAERAILARLDHPNVARILDGGTTKSGLPYFVMELVEGLPLDEYCDQHRYSTVERVKLFRKVCEAVEYAHQNLIVHRDLKPSNILVGANGEPKLLDFGIAKLLDEHAPQQTLTGFRMMTPEYASPEQVRGEPITTASDTYSLGVILYELLTGRRPYKLTARAPAEAALVVCQAEPERPSSVVRRPGETATADELAGTREGRPDRLRRKLAGDLDNIILMALRKDPRRRYASAGALSEDLWRYLYGAPVKARGDSFRYRAEKFIQRNRVMVAAAGLAALGLLGGTAAALREARIARAERARAERRFNDVRKLANAFLFDFHDSVAKLPGSTETRALVVRKALDYLDSLAAEAGGDTGLQRELAAAYSRVGDVLGRPGEANLGDPAGALRNYEKARAILEEVYKADPGIETRISLAAVYGRLSESRVDPARSEQLARQAVDLLEPAYAADPANVRIANGLGSALWDLAATYTSKGDYAAALPVRRRILEIFQDVERQTGTPRARRNVALAEKTLGSLFTRLGQLDAALEHLSRAAEIDGALLAQDPANPQTRMDFTFSVSDYGYALGRLGKYDEAIAQYRRALPIRRELAQQDPKDARARRSLAATLQRLGHFYALKGDFATAMPLHQEALALRNTLPAGQEENLETARHYQQIAEDFAAKSRNAEACAWFRRALQVYGNAHRNKPLYGDALRLFEYTTKEAARCGG